MTANDNTRPVLFFDGECNLCNGLVQFIARHDRKKIFLFASLQSQKGKEVLAHLPGLNGSAPDSLILFYRGKYLIKSAAALQVAKLLGGLSQLLYAGIILPRFLRDAVYDIVSRNRYKWFGKRDECMIPTAELRERFIG